MTRKLRKVGNSYAFLINKGQMDAMGIDPDTPLDVSIVGAQMIIRPADVGFGENAVRGSIKKQRKRYGPMMKRLAK